MTNRKSIFRFKQFECSHARSSMKIGVDAVLLGAWADTDQALSILDVGTGCGVIALMCAQKNPVAKIDAIDIDPDSVEEARQNFSISPWKDRMNAMNRDFNSITGVKYDLIISNPPFFNSGIETPDSRRLIARHDGSLSPYVLLSKGRELLSDSGKIAMIVPAERMDELLAEASRVSLYASRICFVKGHQKAPVKRIMMEFKKVPDSMERSSASAAGIADSDTLILELSPGIPTQGHRDLCAPFYLYF